MTKQDLIEQYESAARRWEEPSIHIAQELHEQAIEQVKQERIQAHA